MLLKFKNFVSKVLYILIIIYLLIFVPKLWGYTPLVVISSSMRPTMEVGSLIYYHHEEINHFEKNDILVYKLKDHIISHRIIKQTGNNFITKGDANKTNDSEIINSSQILGKGTNWAIPFLGYYADFIYTHKYLLYIIVGLLIIDMCNDYLHKKRNGGLHEKES